MKRFQIVSDIHGSLADERATEASLAFAREFKPEIRVIAGDLWDFAAIRTGASEDERSKSMREDFEIGAKYADRFFKGGKTNVLMLGNHDDRVYKLAESSDGVKRDLGQKMVRDIKYVARRNKAKLIPYDSRFGVFRMGHLVVIHGFHAGQRACAEHAKCYDNVVFGHVHSIDAQQIPGLKQKEARSIGCLCDLNPDYMQTKTGKLRWAHGWAFGFVHDDGTYSLFQVRGIDGKFYAPTGFKAF